MPCCKLHHRTKLCSKHANLPSHMALNFFKNPACMHYHRSHCTQSSSVFYHLLASYFFDLDWSPSAFTMLRSPPSLLARLAAFISLHWLMNLVSSCNAKFSEIELRAQKNEIRTGKRRLNMFHNFPDTNSVFQPKLRGWHASCSISNCVYVLKKCGKL